MGYQRSIHALCPKAPQSNGQAVAVLLRTLISHAIGVPTGGQVLITNGYRGAAARVTPVPSGDADLSAILSVVGRQSRLKTERRAERYQRREQRRLARERGAEDGARRGCLICRRSDGGFTTEEHIVPESLGNSEKILPYGVVCDRCNHEVCAQLDEALCTFMPIQMLRTLRQQPTKWHKDLPSPLAPSRSRSRPKAPAPSRANASRWCTERW